MHTTSNDVCYKFTKADLQAYCLLEKAGVIPISTNNNWTATSAGDYIIQLAAKITAERSAVAVDPGSGISVRIVEGGE
jgi:hypothetical protein